MSEEHDRYAGDERWVDPLRDEAAEAPDEARPAEDVPAFDEPDAAPAEAGIAARETEDPGPEAPPSPAF